VFETTDIDELTAAQEDWEVHHRPVRPEKFEGSLSLGRIGRIQVDLERWNTGLELTGTSPREGISFVLPLRDNGSYLSEGVELAADRIDVFGPGCEIHALVKPQPPLIACSLPTEALYERINSPSATLLAEHSTGHRVIRSTRQAVDNLRRWWLKLLDLSAEGTIAAAAHDRLLEETLLVIARALSSGEEAFVARSRRRYLLARRARDFMLDRQSNPPTVTDVCTFLYTTERTLHYAFSESYGVSPKRFLKAQRLYAARQGLKSATESELVSDVAVRLGFWDMGYFARDYKTMFGELPSATLSRQ
jgi:AraC family ethanolamine operon transcriptional activator